MRISDLAAEWAEEYHFDAILSTDGDGDRPLVADETRQMAARRCGRHPRARYYFAADTVVAPVSCNTAVERCGWFRVVLPHAHRFPLCHRRHAAGGRATARPAWSATRPMAGSSPRPRYGSDGRQLAPLPTRDPVIVQLAILGLARREAKTISQLLAALPQRFTASDRLQNFPSEISQARLQRLIAGGAAAMETLFPEYGALARYRHHRRPAHDFRQRRYYPPAPLWATPPNCAFTRKPTVTRAPAPW